MKKTIIGGIVTLIVLLSSGTTWYIQSRGEKTSCKNGFEYVTKGEFEGYYSCTTLSGIRYELCFNVYNSTTNRENYWCEKGKIIEIPKEVPYVYSGKEYICHKRGIGCQEINHLI